nr:MAG TPA: hypothetical protein [Bacteriophage sp.]
MSHLPKLYHRKGDKAMIDKLIILLVLQIILIVLQVLNLLK